MLNKKVIGVALACALALGAWSGAALATPINVGGVVFDPASPFNITMQAINFRESAVATPGNTLMGYGLIGSVNNNLQATFCPGCQLTFTFQYTLSNVYTGGSQPQAVFTNGSLQFYVESGIGSFDVMNPASASAGTQWLTLSGHTAPASGFTQPGQLGQLYSNVQGSVAQPGNNSSGFGYLDATGGQAAPYFNTNTFNLGTYGFADFNLTSSFLFDGVKICQGDTCYPINGAGTLKGSAAVPVPEPGSIGLLGGGLAILGLLLRRRNREAAGRA